MEFNNSKINCQKIYSNYFRNLEIFLKFSTHIESNK